jgi:hypothetical protein
MMLWLLSMHAMLLLLLPAPAPFLLLLLQGCAVDDVIATIVKSGGPENNGTQAEAVKWHDDKVGNTSHNCIMPLA